MACPANAPETFKAISTTTSSSFPSLEMAKHSYLRPYQHRPQKKQKQDPHHRHHHQEEQRAGEHEQEQEQDQGLLPGLPDHVAQLCLAGLPPRLLFALCRSWRRVLYSPSFPPFLSVYALLSSPSSPSSVELHTFDPLSNLWHPLPHHPQLRHLRLHHPSFLSRTLPVQSVAAAGRLVLLAATTDSLLPALPRPLVFDPSTARWRLGAPLRNPRRWCAAGAAGGRVYVASGIGHAYSADVARSVERWDPSSSGWERVAPLRDGRFSREAVDLVASGGKLCMVNITRKGAKEGAVYDIASDRWEKMPLGLMAGWTGPAAAVEELALPAGGGGGGSSSAIYVADEADGVLRAYDWARDDWTTVACSERLRGGVHMTAGGGRVCVACAGGDELAVVDVTARPARVWFVDPPAGQRVVALHVLPRMSRIEYQV